MLTGSMVSFLGLDMFALTNGAAGVEGEVVYIAGDLAKGLGDLFQSAGSILNRIE